MGSPRYRVSGEGWKAQQLHQSARAGMRRPRLGLEGRREDECQSRPRTSEGASGPHETCRDERVASEPLTLLEKLNCVSVRWADACRSLGAHRVRIQSSNEKDDCNYVA